MPETPAVDVPAAAVPRAVFFDLYGTLVRPFRRREHEDAIGDCARILGVGSAGCHRLWTETFLRRIRGEYPTVADAFGHIVRELTGRTAPTEVLEAAEDAYLRFTTEGLRPVAGAVALLDWLRAAGVPLALVTNCAPDVPRAWARSVLSPYFVHCAFSCRVGSVKPEPEIYRDAVAAVGVRPRHVLYVGDGSDGELTGAAACGLGPVLVAADLSNTYDVLRHDVDAWSGPRIGSLGELRSFFTGA